MKFKKIFCVSFALLLTLTIQTALATEYSDVSSLSSNFTAINYLSDLGIIQGYPDQTFHPQQPVNRVEFLKLALESSDIKTDVETPTPFPDIDEKAWYAKYVRKAKAEGWIRGYEDGSFKPENPINKAEALKIIGQIQQWKTETDISEKPFGDTAIDAWYTKYIAYAKDKNFLEERTSSFFPESILSREKTGELLFRSYITRKSGAEKFSLSLAAKYPASSFMQTTVNGTESATSATLDFTPVSYKTYPPDFYEDVTLTESFPNTFYENEVYYIEGNAPSTEESSLFVFLSPPNGENINYVTEIENNNFKVPLIFRESGNFQMGLILGNQGESKIANISVLPDLPEMPSNETENKPSSIKVEYKDQKTNFSWDNKGLDFIKMTITQNKAEKTFFFRQGTQDFDVNYTDFTDFNELKTYVTMEGAELKSESPLQFETNWSMPAQKSFIAVTHVYSEILDSYISINSLPEVLSTLSKITFTGTAKKNIFSEAAVIKPDGLVDLFDLTSSSPFEDYFGSKIIPGGNDFTFKYTPKTNGTYVLEINGTDGSAILNTPVYINNGLPLIPDFFDLNIYTQPESDFNLQTARTKMLNLINEERKAVGLPAVSIDDKLNTLAQNHSQDMMDRDFFAHVNPDGKTPEARRLEANIPMPVGENLAISPTVLYAHKGLMQSGIHRNNILDPKWTKVGIGIAINSSGSLLVTQEFSSDKYTENDLLTIEDNILAAINNKRSSLGLNFFQIESNLDLVANQWSYKMVTQDFFDFTSPNGDSLSDLVNQYESGKPVQALILSSGDETKLMEEAIKSDEISSNTWQKIGIGVKNDQSGTLKATILFTTY
ncbi:S-layer homology domain-containing protein [Patescibacteria group bacterium]|nr:S-layer homology domain-containing protein [Patescibacteria group bacterium]MBU1703674.1 S-layer homology domain-containing protein [Patescibacteria group bacterium]MBU1953941.1 S-layer homology domain-containing protein [Patescibacteria group bacterium]